MLYSVQRREAVTESFRITEAAARFAKELADETSKANKLLSSIVQLTAHYGDTF
jgi:hypothetical protein